MRRIFDLYWSPEGRKIARVSASSLKQALGKAPMPYRKYKGEIYVVDVGKSKYI